MRTLFEAVTIARNTWAIDTTANHYGADIYSARTCSICESELLRFSGVEYETNQNVCLFCIATELRVSSAILAKVVKLLVGCEVCGYSRISFALDLDHLDASTKARTKSGKVIEPSDGFRNWSIKTSIAEIQKCQILCSTHHKEKTARERGIEL